MKKEKIFSPGLMHGCSRAWLIQDGVLHVIADYREGYNLQSNDPAKKHETLSLEINRSGENKRFVYGFLIGGQYPLESETLRDTETQLRDFARKTKGLGGFCKDSESDFRLQKSNISVRIYVPPKTENSMLYIKQIEKVPDLEVVLNNFVSNGAPIFNKLSKGTNISYETVRRVLETARQQDKYPIKESRFDFI